MIMDDGISDLAKKIKNSFYARKKTYANKAWSFYKEQRSRFKRIGYPSFYLWILGCQRSGTTLLERIFRQDLDSAVFGEFSELTIGTKRTVLKPFAEIKDILLCCNARYAVIRPLFESDRVCEILDFFQPSLGIWMFRDPLYVVNSMINKWGDDFFEISRHVETGSDGQWRLENLYVSIKKEAKELTGTDKRIEDLYALYWLKRNEFTTNHLLSKNHQILFLNYALLASNPKHCTDTILIRAGQTGVWKYFNSDAHTFSLNRKLTLSITPKIYDQCNSFYHAMLRLGERDFSGR